MFSRFLISVALLGVLACGGSNPSPTKPPTPPPPPPVVTTMGYFRGMKPAPAQSTYNTMFADESNNATVTMSYPRESHSARNLPTGDVLIAGGYERGPQGNEIIPVLELELFSPETERFRKTGKFLGYRTVYPGITNVGGRRTVIFGGNMDPCGMYIYRTDDNSLEFHDLFDAQGNRPGAALYNVMYSYQLPNDRIVAISNRRDIVLIDVNTATFEVVVPNTRGNFFGFSAAKVGNVVYLAGGASENGGVVTMYDDIDKFDISTLTFTPSVGKLSSPRVFHGMARLQDGRIGIYGGRIAANTENDFTKVVEVFDPATNVCTIVGNLLKSALGDKALQLANGFVVYLGGWSDGEATRQELFYDHATNTSGTTGLMTSARLTHTVTPLNTGRVLITGGYGNPQSIGPNVTASLTTNTAEIYEPESKLYVTMPTDTLEYGASLQMHVEYVTPDVTWALIPNEAGVVSEGIIDQTGLYVAPTHPINHTVTVKVTSKTDPKVFAVVVLTLVAPVIPT